MKILNRIRDNLTKKKLTRLNVIVSCIILTLLCTAIAVNSSDLLFKYDLPQKNFVTLKISVSVENSPCDTGDLSSYLQDDCGSKNIFESRASATALKSVGGYSYFLTADHFCNTDQIQNRLESSTNEYSFFTDMKIIKDSKEYVFEIVYQDYARDLCLIRSEEYVMGEQTRLADSMPEVGEEVVTISSPLGISENNINLHFSGMFSGCNESTCFFTVPAISGSSGSLILNRDNEVVGITQSALINFPEVTIGVGIHTIREFLQEYKEKSGIDVLN